MDLIVEILKNCKDALLGCSGGLVAYLYHFSQHREKDSEAKFDLVTFIINGVVGGFMAFVMGGLVPTTLDYRDGLIGLVGVVGFGLMGAVESKLVDNLLKKFFNK